MIVKKSNLPIHSILNGKVLQFDYVDSFVGEVFDKGHRITALDLAKAFFSSGPKWVGVLFIIRNKIVALFGLKTAGKATDRKAQLEGFEGKQGEQLGLFKVFDSTANEVVLGEDDKHLNFRVSLFIDKECNHNGNRCLTITTTVKFNNRLGRLYFIPVRPFHKLIVPSMLRGMLKELERIIISK